jgi:hypothetical protein
VTARFQLRLQLPVIEDFPVKHDPEASVFITDRLASAFQVNDAETYAAYTGQPISIDSEFIRATMPDHFQHLSKDFGIGWVFIREI